MTIHTIGDSHSFHGWDQVSIVKHHLGAKLCFSFARDAPHSFDITSFGINDGDIVIFCLGEIDCRCHVQKYIHESSYQSIIDSLVENYANAVDQYMTILNKKGSIRVGFYNVVPPVRKNRCAENPDQPYLGTDDERKQYVLYFNQRLKERCEKNNNVYFDVYDHYTDADGFLRPELSDGNVHIREGTPILQFVETKLL